MQNQKKDSKSVKNITRIIESQNKKGEQNTKKF